MMKMIFQERTLSRKKLRSKNPYHDATILIRKAILEREFSYNEWKQHADIIEETLSHSYEFDVLEPVPSEVAHNIFNGMKRLQRVYDRHIHHNSIMHLLHDAHEEFNYPDCKKDIEKAINHFLRFEDRDGEKVREKMGERQRMYKGDRPNDNSEGTSISGNLKLNEDSGLKKTRLVTQSTSALKKKKRISSKNPYHDTMILLRKAISEHVFSYNEWKQHADIIEETLSHSYEFDVLEPVPSEVAHNIFNGMKRLQRVYDRHIHHNSIMHLLHDAHEEFNYPDCKKDIEKAINHFLRFEDRDGEKVREKMGERQRMYKGDRPNDNSERMSMSLILEVEPGENEELSPFEKVDFPSLDDSPRDLLQGLIIETFTENASQSHHRAKPEFALSLSNSARENRRRIESQLVNENRVSANLTTYGIMRSTERKNTRAIIAAARENMRRIEDLHSGKIKKWSDEESTPEIKAELAQSYDAPLAYKILPQQTYTQSSVLCSDHSEQCYICLDG